MLRSATLVSLLLLSACSSRGVTTVATPSALSPSMEAKSEQLCEATQTSLLGAEAAHKRRLAIGDLLSGKFRRATTAFTEIVADQPNDVASIAMLAAAKRLEALARAHEADSLRHAQVIKVEPIPTDEEDSGKPERADGKSIASVRIDRLSKLTPDPSWREKHGFDDPVLTESEFGEFVVADVGWESSFVHADHRIELFGEHVLGLAGIARKPIVYDFGGESGAIKYAQVFGDALVVRFDGSGGARPASKGMIAAYDLSTGVFRWRTSESLEPTGTFLGAGNFIIAGSSDSSGEARLVGIDLHDGSIQGKVTLEQSAETLFRENNRIFSETTVLDVMRVDFLGPLPAPLPASIDAEAGSQLERTIVAGAEARCRFERSIALFDARQGLEAEKAIAALDTKKIEPTVLQALTASAQFLQRGQSGDEELPDLTSAPVLHVDSTLRPNQTGCAAATEHPRLVGVKGKIVPTPPGAVASVSVPLHRANPRTKVAPREENEGEIVTIDPPSPSRIGFLLPDYGDLSHDWYESFPSGNVATFGHFLVTLRENVPERSYDLKSLFQSLEEDPTQIEKIHVLGVALRQDRLFVTLGEKEPTDRTGQRSRLFALDRKTGALLWKSATLVSNRSVFPLDDYLVTVHRGPEKSTLRLIRQDSGEVIDTVELALDPEKFGVVKDEVVVVDKFAKKALYRFTR